MRLVQKIDPALIGQKISSERVRRGYTVEKLAELVNYDISTISRMENGVGQLEKYACQDIYNIIIADDKLIKDKNFIFCKIEFFQTFQI